MRHVALTITAALLIRLSCDPTCTAHRQIAPGQVAGPSQVGCMPAAASGYEDCMCFISGPGDKLDLQIIPEKNGLCPYLPQP